MHTNWVRRTHCSMGRYFKRRRFLLRLQRLSDFRIVDRTAINDNFDAHIKGGELEASWVPFSGLKLKFAGGYEDAKLANGSHSVDLMDRTAGNSDWMVVKPFITQASPTAPAQIRCRWNTEYARFRHHGRIGRCR